MATILEIKYDGNVPGLKDNRLSLSAFGPALNALLVSLRRIATGMVGDAIGPQELSKGRLKQAARDLDIEIASVIKGSSGISGMVTITPPIGHQFPLMSDLPERTINEFLDAVEQEGNNRLRNTSVRQYLKLLPGELTSQVYTYRNSATERVVKLGSVSLPSVPTMSSVKEYVGLVVGVGFEPGRPEIRLKSLDGKVSLIFSASQSQVDRALDLRNHTVRVLAVKTEHARVLRIEPADSARFELTEELEEKFLYQRWHNVLSIFAQ